LKECQINAEKEYTSMRSNSCIKQYDQEIIDYKNCYSMRRRNFDLIETDEESKTACKEQYDKTKQ
jgi:hypothetical protein